MTSSDPKAPKKKLGGEATDPLVSDAMVQNYLKLLKDYQNVVFGVLVLVVVVGALTVLQRQRSQETEDAAWREVAGSKKIEDLEPLVRKYEGTGAHAFLSMTYAAKLYERGSKEDLQAARAVLERAKDEVRGNELIAELVRHQLAGIDKELADESLWAKPAGASDASVGSGDKTGAPEKK